MRPKTFQPVTLLGFKRVLQRYGYRCVVDQDPVLAFEKDGIPPHGHEEAAQYWPNIVTHRYPDWDCDALPDQLVYNSSDIVDFVVKILISAIPAIDRTEVAVEIRAILKTHSDERESRETESKVAASRDRG